MGSNQRRHKKFIKQLIYFLIGLSVFFAVIFYGRSLEERSTHFFVKFKNPDNKFTQEFKLEIADTLAERAKGLMYRKEMPESDGMIFVYPSQAVQSFWMKNTYIPLDMIFIQQDWKVAGVLNDVPVMNTESRSVEKPSTYVIELNAGQAAKHCIKEGSQLIYQDQPPKAKD